MSLHRVVIAVAGLLTATAVAAVAAEATTPVPILKQINRQNEDGSYSFGYEAADGSFKIETKHPNGDVEGKYGYVDDSGELREVSYGASSAGGFRPEGSGIVIPPPVRDDPAPSQLRPGETDDGQYREDPRIYEDPKYNRAASSHSATSASARLPAFPRRPFVQQYHEPVVSTPQPDFRQPQYQQPQYQQPQYQQPQYQQPQYQQPQYQQTQYQPQQYQPQPYQQTQYHQPKYEHPQYQQPQYQQTQYQTQYDQFPEYRPRYQSQQLGSPFDAFAGHPAQNFDPATGSYSITYSG